MRHDWSAQTGDIQNTPTFMLRDIRKCANCGAIQEKCDKQRWGRIVGYYHWPLVGRCGPKAKVISDAYWRKDEN